MPKTIIPLIKGDKVSVETDYRDALPVNMFAVQKEILGASGYMTSFPGLTELAELYGPCRAGLYNERLEGHYRVLGDRFCRLEADNSITILGVIPGAEQCAVPYSFNTQAIIANGQMFLYDPTLGFREVTDTDLGNPIDGVWIDGYYFMTDGEYIFHTDISDESSIDPLKFATAEFMPDASLGVGKTADNKVVVFGRYSIEYFVDDATENFAFTRVETRAQKLGIVATHAKCEAGGSWFITGGHKEESIGVYILSIGSTQKVSTREIDKVLAQYTEPELVDMRMEARLEDGTTFIYVHLPNEVLVFNYTIANSLGLSVAWTKLKTGKEDGVYRAINGVFDAKRGYWVYGDKNSGKLGKLDSSIFTQYGEKQEWYLYTPFINLETMSIDELEINTIPGYNTLEDATVATSITYDGLTYSTEWWEMYGTKDNYTTRFILRRLGYIPNWIGFRFRGLTTAHMAFAGLEVTYG